MALSMPPGFAASTPSVGTQATSPTNNLVAPSNAISPSQAAIKDLSGTYGKASNGTIYNTKSQTAFSNPSDFFKDSGQTSFDNLKFADYTPTGKETIYGQAASTPKPQAPAVLSPTPYTPPNQGTTGVSQGGLIGNLIAQSQSPSQAYSDAQKEVNKVLAEQAALQADYGNQNADILSRPEGLTQQTGQQGILQQLFATKQAGLQSKYAGAASQLAAANTQQGLQVQAGTSAGQLNAPQFVSPGQVQVNPSQPTPGSTTSGAANLNNLVGSRSVPGQTQMEYFDKNTGQGFATPQALADFVNKQTGGNSATAQNVFDILKNQGAGGSSLLGVDDSTLQTYAQMLASGQGASIPSSVTGNLALMAKLYQMAQSASGGAFNTNEALAKGQSVGDLTNQKSQLQASFNGAKANFQLLLDTAQKGGVNDSNVPALNALNQAVQQGLTSSAAVNNFRETLAAVRSQYASIIGGGSVTVESLQQASNIIPDDISLAALRSLAVNMESVANNRIAGIDNQINSLKGGNNPQTSSGGSTTNMGGGVSAGGHTFVQNAQGQWVAQ